MQVSVTIGDKDDDTSAAEARGAQSIVLPIEGQGRRKITINTAELEDKVQADAILLARPVPVTFLLINLIIFIRARPVRLSWN